MMLNLAAMMLTLAAVGPVNSQGLTDPTRPSDYLPSSTLSQPLPDELADWHLTAVRIGKEGSSAVLNGRVVRPGDRVGRARVLEIKPGAVTVELDLKRVEVNLYSRGVSKKLVKGAGNPVEK